MSRILSCVRACSLIGALALACGDDDDPLPAECEEIIEACHDLDTGEGEIHECHESAEEEWSQAECQANLEMCLEVCAPPEAAAGTAAP